MSSRKRSNTYWSTNTFAPSVAICIARIICHRLSAAICIDRSICLCSSEAICIDRSICHRWRAAICIGQSIYHPESAAICIDYTNMPPSSIWFTIHIEIHIVLSKVCYLYNALQRLFILCTAQYFRGVDTIYTMHHVVFSGGGYGVYYALRSIFGGWILSITPWTIRYVIRYFSFSILHSHPAMLIEGFNKHALEGAIHIARSISFMASAAICIDKTNIFFMSPAICIVLTICWSMSNAIHIAVYNIATMCASMYIAPINMIVFNTFNTYCHIRCIA